MSFGRFENRKGVKKMKEKNKKEENKTKITDEKIAMKKVKECKVYQFPQMKDKLFIEVIDVMKLIREVVGELKK